MVFRVANALVGTANPIHAASDVHLSKQHLDRLDELSRPTLGFPADVMREASVVAGVYGAQLPDIDDPRAQAVRRTTTGT